MFIASFNNNRIDYSNAHYTVVDQEINLNYNKYNRLYETPSIRRPFD